MTFKNWIQQSGLSQAEIAEQIGLTQSAVSKIAARGTGSLQTALKIHAFTNKAVSLDSLLSAPRARSVNAAAQ